MRGKGQKASVRLSSSEVRDQKSEISGSASQSAIGNHKSEVCRLTSDLRPPTSVQAALLLYPHIWRTMRDFEPGTTLMVVANIKYDEADYIRDRVEFERVARDWKTLGGSVGS